MLRLASRLGMLGLAVCLLTGASAKADPITSGQWYEFSFGGPGSDAGSGSSGTSSLGTPFFDPGNPAWTITAGPSGLAFTVTDAFEKGDSFSVFDFSTLVGSTPSVPQDPSASQDDPIAALADPGYSHASFLLGAGDHSLTIVADDSPFGGGGAYFRADVVPEPSSLALIGVAGVAGLGLRVLRRRVAGTVRV